MKPVLSVESESRDLESLADGLLQSSSVERDDFAGGGFEGYDEKRRQSAIAKGENDRRDETYCRRRGTSEEC